MGSKSSVRASYGGTVLEYKTNENVPNVEKMQKIEKNQKKLLTFP